MCHSEQNNCLTNARNSTSKTKRSGVDQSQHHCCHDTVRLDDRKKFREISVTTCGETQKSIRLIRDHRQLANFGHQHSSGINGHGHDLLLCVASSVALK